MNLHVQSAQHIKNDTDSTDVVENDYNSTVGFNKNGK
jgi:hypothetical protein